jgi:hypothetical protein
MVPEDLLPQVEPALDLGLLAAFTVVFDPPREDAVVMVTHE